MEENKNNSFNLPDGIMVPSTAGLFNSYQLDQDAEHTHFKLNLSLEVLRELITWFLESLPEPFFLIMEIPATESEEQRLRQKETDPFHYGVYYLENLTRAEALKVWQKHQELLLHDGISNFGFATQDNSAEIMVGKYNVTSIFTTDPLIISQQLGHLKIQAVPLLETVWDHFTSENPGRSGTIKIKGQSVYDLVEELKAFGLYIYEYRQD